MSESEPEVELTVTVALVEGAVTVYGFIENHLDNPIRIEGATSSLYDITVLDNEDNYYGESMGALQAPHAIDISGGHSWTISRSFATFEGLEEYNEEIDLDMDMSGYDPLEGEEGFVAPIDSEYDRELTVTVNVYTTTNLETGEEYDMEQTVTFVPSELPEGSPEGPELPADEDASLSMSSGGTVWS